MKQSLSNRVAYLLATWFGCGRVPLAPGTVGTLAAIPLFLLVRPGGTLAVFATTVVLMVVGIWAAGRVEKGEGKHDPQIVVIDEVAGVHATLLAAPQGWKGLLVGVLLFRIFDQLKPWPARAAERRLPGGFGIVLDDMVAGIWGAFVLLGLRYAGLL